MKSETQEIYLVNEVEGCAVRYALDGTYWAKFSEKLEYQIYQKEHHELGPDEYAIYEDRDMIFDSFMMGVELTQEEYYNY